MGDKTKIQWTDASWNPVRGCARVSAGCEHCYAETVARRFSGEGQPYEGLINRHGAWNGEIKLVPEKLEEPLRWKRPRRVFVNSMSDLFHANIPGQYRDRVFAVMRETPQHTYQILTKRPQLMRYYIQAWGLAPGRRWPLPNVWLGVSVEDQQSAVDRILNLLRTPAAVRFVSYEPALGPLHLHHVRACRRSESGTWIDWLIVGGESGPGARPCKVQWVRDVVRDCDDQGVACFVKQMGAVVVDRQDRIAGRYDDEWPVNTPVNTSVRIDGQIRMVLNARKGDDPSEWPPALRVRQYPGDTGPTTGELLEAGHDPDDL